MAADVSKHSQVQQRKEDFHQPKKEGGLSFLSNKSVFLHANCILVLTEK